jgi:hypothetical protein
MKAEEFFVPGNLYRWLGDNEIYLVLALDFGEEKPNRKFWDSHITVQYLACNGEVLWLTLPRSVEVYKGQCRNFVKVT